MKIMWCVSKGPYKPCYKGCLIKWYKKRYCFLMYQKYQCQFMLIDWRVGVDLRRGVPANFSYLSSKYTLNLRMNNTGALSLCPRHESKAQHSSLKWSDSMWHNDTEFMYEEEMSYPCSPYYERKKRLVTVNDFAWGNPNTNTKGKCNLNSIPPCIPFVDYSL